MAKCRTLVNVLNSTLSINIIIYSGICLITVLRSNWLQCPNIDMSKPQMDMLWVCTHESGLDIRLEGR